MSCFDPASKPCSGGARPGAKALMVAIIERFPVASSAGIYNCRDVNHPTNTGPSVHGNGRALDVHFPGECHPEGDRLVTELRAVATKLEVQFIIWCRRKYGCEWGFTSRPYGGYSHTDHVHIELTIVGGETLTVERIDQVWPKEEDLTSEEHDALVRVDGNVADVEGGMNLANQKLDQLLSPSGPPALSNADVQRIARAVLDEMQIRLRS